MAKGNQSRGPGTLNIAMDELKGLKDGWFRKLMYEA